MDEKALVSLLIARDAEDIAQKVCELLLESDARLLRSFRGQSTLSTWLIGIVRNQALMHLRREKTRAALPPRAPAAGRGPLDELMSIENDEQLAAALAAVPPRDRLLLTLHYLDGLPYPQIAAVLGVAVNSVGPLLDRARERLKKKSV